MSVLITDDILRQANMSEPEFKLELGIFLYTNNILTTGKASEFAGLPKVIFQKKLSDRDIAVSYDEEEFLKDLATVRKNYGDLNLKNLNLKNLFNLKTTKWLRVLYVRSFFF